ncbi:MAG: hypothetical protein AAFZ89_06960, partial [Bacteroidota bacterium]
MKLFIAIVCLGCMFMGVAQRTFETGKIIDSILVSNSTNETFTLYLPSSFDQSALSPILIIFEPGGRGKIGINAFVEASEKYGHILVCSNDAKNGPYERNFNIANRLFAHVFSNFNVGENQIYLAGFSGGARLASAIAAITDKMTGVIACGAGFSNVYAHRPTYQDFSYVAICGNRDMNYREIINVKGYLDKLNFDHTLITYEGNHSWPSSEQILKAFDWLNIRSHVKGYQTKRTETIHKSYQSNWLLARKAETEEKWLDAEEGYSRLIKTYASFFEVDTVEQRLKLLQKKPAYKKLVKSRTKALKLESKLSDTFHNRLSQDFSVPQNVDMDWWKQEMGSLEKMRSSSDPELVKMAERVRFMVFAIAYEKNAM